MRKWKSAIFAFTIGLLVMSCNNEREYEFVIENNTNYVLDIVEFGCGVNDQSQMVNSNSTTEQFVIKYNPPFLSLSQPLLCLSIKNYSDSLTRYESGLGRTFGIDDLSRRKTNYLIIDLKPSPIDPNDIFDMRIQN